MGKKLSNLKTILMVVMTGPIMLLTISALNGNKTSFKILVIIMELTFAGAITICINEEIKNGFQWSLTICIFSISIMMFLFPVLLKKAKH